MAGVVPVVPPQSGSMDGRLEVQAERFVTLDELLTHFPAYKTFLDELSQKGWQYHFIDGYGRVVMEMSIDQAPYSWQASEHPRGGFAYTLSMDFGRRLPKLELKSITSLDRFIVNICSQDYPRAVTVELTRNEVAYVHDSLWVLKGEGCPIEAKRVLEILQWLVEEKNFKLVASGGEKHYRELAALLKK